MMNPTGYLVFLFLYPIIVFTQDCANVKGEWINELGSVLQIDSVTGHGELAGVYKSSTGVDGRIFPLQGWLNFSDQNPDEINISFSVKWEGYGSITSWTGYCYSDGEGPKIKTLWHLVRSGKDFDWERIITNASTFKAVN